jgi:hypothetical protein
MTEIPKEVSYKFPLGQIVATSRVVDELPPEAIQTFLRRHVTGDWGDLGKDDVRANELALVHGDRILSKYSTTVGESVYVITEYDRSLTTVLFVSDY